MLKKCPFLFILLAVGMVSAVTLDIPEYLFVEQDLEGCYLLKDKYDLYWFANKVNTENTTYATACAKLTADIVVNTNVLTDGQGTGCVGSTGSYSKCSEEFRKSLYGWTPIGSSDNPFAGTFDGLGHTISGLYDGREVSYTGLFGYVSGTNAKVSIKNVGVEDSYFRVKSYAGGIVGMVYDGSGVLNIENVYSASTFCIKGEGYVGGLIGRVGANWTLNITNAYNSGSIFGTSGTTTASYVAGLAGHISKSASVNIKNAFNNGNLNGYAPLVNLNASVQNSYYLGDVAQGSYGVNKSASDFSDGTVLNLLKEGENGFVWQSGSPNPTLLINSHKADLVYLGDGVARGLIYFIEGFGYAKSLPTIYLDGSPILGWYENQSFTGTKYTEIPADVKRDLQLYPKLYKPVDDCYEISDADELYAYASIVNGTLAEERAAEPTACGKLTADIVVNQNVLGTDNANVNADGSYNNAQAASAFRVWTPIGNSTNKFQGTFNGKGHTISGLYFNNPETDNVGLFGYTSGAVTIEGVGVVDSYFRGDEYVGSIVGQAEPTVTVSGKLSKALTVTKSYNKGFVMGTSNVGGLVGKNGNVQFSYNTGSVTGTSNVGGLVGSNILESQNKFEINGSYNVGLVKMGTGSGNAVLGEGCPTGSQTGAVKNVYYLDGFGDACLGAHSKTSYEFADGFVAITLHNDRTVTGANIWGQVVGADKTPTLTGEIRFLLKDGCFEIANEEDLYFFAAAVNNGVNSEVCVKLTADITVNENVLGTGNANVDDDGSYKNAQAASSFRPWTPIGNWDNPFQGTFHGQGHTISGLYFSDTKTEDVGLFGDVSGTVVIDGVGLVDSYIGGNRCVGGLVGFAQGSLTISDSYNASFVNTPGSGFGGLVGAASESGSSLIISNSYNIGSLNGQGFGGGLVGYADALVVSNSYNAGSVYVSGDDAYVGGITSSVDETSTITNCFNYGTISAANSKNKDDLVADGGTGAVIVTNSFYLGSSSSGDYGTVKSSTEFANGTVLAALRDGEGGYVWVQAEGDKYPTIDVNASTNAKTIVLDWTSAADSTTLDAAGYTDGAMVIVKDGKQFYAGGAIYEGILSAGQVAAIGSNKLYPISGVELETVDGKLVATLDGDSDESLLIPTDVQVDTVVYKRNVMANTFTTVMLPFSVPATSVENHSFYKFKRVADDPVYTYAVKVSSVTGTLKANRPYIMIDSEGSTQIKFNVSGEKLVLNTTAESYDASSTYDGITWTMRGMFKYKQWLEGDSELGHAYGFAAQEQNGSRIGQFVKLGKGASIVPMRMYLTLDPLPTPKGAPGRPGRPAGYGFSSIASTPEFIGIDIEDDDEVEDDEEETMVVNRVKVIPTVIKDNRWFDMKGRALNGKPTAKGTYYHNGKKVIIK